MMPDAMPSGRAAGMSVDELVEVAVALVQLREQVTDLAHRTDAVEYVVTSASSRHGNAPLWTSNRVVSVGSKTGSACTAEAWGVEA